MTGREYKNTNMAEERVSAARKEIRESMDRDKATAALRAAGARDIDPEAVDALAVLAEERMAELVARAVESMKERDETRISAGSVAVAAQREAEERSIRREFQKVFV